MRKLLVIASAVALSLNFAGVVSANAADHTYALKDGKCRDEGGHFAKADFCKANGPAHMYKLDKKGKCRDEKGKFAKDEFCHH
jgi:hypothetical protein